jgi:hypothetical protein
MDPIDKNIIRQVLMNEMGMTREAIRREMDEIIVETARAYLGNLFQTGFLTKMVETEVARLLSDSHESFLRGERPLKQIIREAAKEKIVALIEKHVKIEVNP